jgi:hypothetical protein
LWRNFSTERFDLEFGLYGIANELGHLLETGSGVFLQVVGGLEILEGERDVHAIPPVVLMARGAC